MTHEFRAHDYNYRIQNEYALPVISLAVLADADPNWRPDAYQVQLLGVGTSFRFAKFKLLDCVQRTDELLRSDNPFAVVTLAQRAHNDAVQSD